MKNLLTTSALILSIALGSVTISAQPVRANEASAGEIATAIGLLALFAYAAKEARDDTKKHRVQPPKKRFSKVLPAKCLQIVQRRNYKQRVYGARCLQNNYRHVNRLPRFCKTEVKLRGQWRPAFNAQCLRREGFTRA
ncbi:hypothetical protein [Nereida sp. MMG025]|uniref:hypothetical protein n=1 Tax=Nereida sp. MMG025 TaxID=2909981 RepID=UPI001F43C519|nr:hypothetical protein [Nereida sp. MMG025]MCF6444756.1 hypothetical protein [Nereida sp. MMG025]